MILNAPHCCRYCKNGAYVNIKREVVCRFCGIVPKSHICKKYVFDPFKYKVRRIRTLDISKYKKEDFSID